MLGCLLEKQRTTPDGYPLTVNALRLACNQSTNRDPVTDYDEATVRETAQELGRKGLARFTSGQGSRAAKYRHVLGEALPAGEDELALLCVMMLRGLQTPGELKGRTGRLHAFAGLDAVQATLERLAERKLVTRLERRPGQKEDRYGHLLGDASAAPEAAAVHEPAASPSPSPSPPPSPDAVRGVGIDQLEIERLERALTRRPRLAQRLFTDDERAYAAARARPGQHLAVRFCAKEAAAKALGLRAWSPRDIEVVATGDAPELSLSGTAAARAAELEVAAMHVSLSHTRTLASAVVVAS